MSGGTIDWASGQKHLVIAPQTWALKSPEARVAAAKNDLIRAGHHADAAVLTTSRLNTAFYKLPPDVRSRYVADRSLHGKTGGSKQPSTGDDASGRAKKQARAERLSSEISPEISRRATRF